MKIEIQQSHERAAHNIKEDDLLCTRKGGDKALEMWSSPADAEIDMQPDMIVIDAQRAMIYHRDASGELWFNRAHMLPELSVMEEAYSVQLPDVPSNNDLGWDSMGMSSQRVNPRSIHEKFVLQAMLEDQQGATADQSCRQLDPSKIEQGEEGIRFALQRMRDVESVLGVSEAALEADALQLVEPILLINPARTWDTYGAWIELIVQSGDNITHLTAANIERGVMCSCQMQALAEGMMRYWLTELKNDASAIEISIEDSDESEVIAAMLILGGEPQRKLPEVHLMMGTNNLSATPLNEPSKPERVLN